MDAITIEKKPVIELCVCGHFKQWHSTGECKSEYCGCRVYEFCSALLIDDADTTAQLESYRTLIVALENEIARLKLPVPLVLHCPECTQQHIDKPDERTEGWVNPPHRSHLCHNCGAIWRPADVETVGVEHIETVGKSDTYDFRRI